MNGKIINGHRLIENEALNRIQLFVSKSYDLGAEGRNRLKTAKFYYAPTKRCYQAPLTHYNKFVAEKLLESFKPLENEQSKNP